MAEYIPMPDFDIDSAIVVKPRDTPDTPEGFDYDSDSPAAIPLNLFAAPGSSRGHVIPLGPIDSSLTDGGRLGHVIPSMIPSLPLGLPITSGWNSQLSDNADVSDQAPNVAEVTEPSFREPKKEPISDEPINEPSRIESNIGPNCTEPSNLPPSEQQNITLPFEPQLIEPKMEPNMIKLKVEPAWTDALVQPQQEEPECALAADDRPLQLDQGAGVDNGPLTVGNVWNKPSLETIVVRIVYSSP